MSLLKSCLVCGEVSDGPRCELHRPKPVVSKASREERGYDWSWRKLSKRARSIQSFCTDCGTTKRLTADHSPEAWKRKAEGKSITLDLIDVVCASCNSKRGSARGETQTWGVGERDSPLHPPAKAKFPILPVSGNPAGGGK
ncbi:hypothetical protein AB4Y86_03470 [Arthrobacter sp. 2YAF22_2]|uniref:hypothetical protein n=1 Tax=Arthrobacter sp. 2YAF22_2 TaxID=3233029 RepID=UPI003F93B2B2